MSIADQDPDQKNRAMLNSGTEGHAECTAEHFYTKLTEKINTLSLNYPAVLWQTITANGRLETTVGYNKSAAQKNSGLFLRQLEQQRQIAPLICSYLEQLWCISASIPCNSKNTFWISLDQFKSGADTDRLLSVIDILLDNLESQRTDQMFSHLVTAHTINNAPYIAASECAPPDIPVVVDREIILMTDTFDPDSLIKHDASLKTLDEQELIALDALFNKMLLPFELEHVFLKTNTSTVRIIPVYFPIDRETTDLQERFRPYLKQAVSRPEVSCMAVSSRLAGHLKKHALQSSRQAKTYNGLYCANWLLIKLTEQLVAQAKLAGFHPSFEVIGTETKAYEYFLRYLNAAAEQDNKMQREQTAVAIVIVLPGANLDTEVLPLRCVVIDIFNLASGCLSAQVGTGKIIHIRNISFTYSGHRLDLDEFVLPLDLKTSLIEALLDGASPWMASTPENSSSRFDAFDTSAQHLELDVEAVYGLCGKLTDPDWQAFYAADPIWNYNFIGSSASVQHSPWLPATPDLTNLCNYIFANTHLESTSVIVDPVTGESYCYAELLELVNLLAHGFKRGGLIAGDVIALAAPDSCSSVAIMLACMIGGWVFCPINYHASKDNIEAMLNAARPKLLLYGEEQKFVRMSLPGNCKHCSVEPFIIAAPRSVSEQGAFPVLQQPGESPAVILFTSGSTGRPKALTHSHADFIRCNQNYAQYVIQIKASDRIYTPSRLFFAYGLNNLVISLFAGATHILATPLPRELRVPDVVGKYRVTVIFAVPVMYKLLLIHNTTGRRFPYLRLCISAGEALPEQLFYELHKALGVTVIDGIGMTEVISTFISARYGDSQAGCTGSLVPGFEVELRTTDGHLCRVGEVGTLWVKGNTLTPGYLNTSGLNAEYFVKGWFNTNDIFYTDYRRRFYYVGRMGRVLKINGCWFSPQMLETVLQSHNAVLECAVCVIKDDYGLARPKAFVVVNENHIAKTDLDKLWNELRKLSKEKMGKDHYPHAFDQVTQLPRTSSGKLDVPELLKITNQPIQA